LTRFLESVIFKIEPSNPFIRKVGKMGYSIGMEIRIGEIPIPLINYVYLIRNRRSPYYDLVQFLLKDMEHHYNIAGKSEIVYKINPRVLHEEIEKKIKDEKLTKMNVCRTILALCYGSKLEEDEDFWVTTTSSGRKNYHIKVNQRTLNLFSGIIR